MPELKESWKWIEGGVGAPKGFLATGVQAGIKYKDKFDVAIVMSEVKAQAAGVFTRNVVKAHPVLLSQKRIQKGQAQAIVVNSGNANACVGEVGDKSALSMTEKTAQSLKIDMEDVLVASTGVIGVPMPMETVLNGIEMAAEGIFQISKKVGDEQISLKRETAHNAALAIMTTDLNIKEAACELSCKEGTIKLGAMAKGSGMIHPNMGTMLGFLTTDAVIPVQQLQKLLQEATDDSFNMVTVDGDTSTNDSVFFLANGASGIALKGEELEQFTHMVKAMCRKMAQEIARDGEGATKFLEVQVLGANNREDARKVAKAICGSSLVKTAVFGEDPNWGRIICAMGYSGVDFNPAKAEIKIGELTVAQNGQGIDFSQEEAKKILQKKDIKITVNLFVGEEEATAWGCDLSYDYVKINGSYTT